MIGILGGAFDPVHHGHLRIALDVLETLNLRQVRMMPLYQATHKAQPGASAEHRLTMLRLALRQQDQLLADDSEIKRSGHSYMVDTLRWLHAEMPGQRFCLLLGGDAFNHFAAWREPESILQLANIVVMQRPDHASPPHHSLKRWLEQGECQDVDAFNQRSAGGIYCQPVTQLAISSTQIRQCLQQGRQADYLLPPQVLDYIHQHHLYALS